jgi:phosphatidylglycerophosphate synthase
MFDARIRPLIDPPLNAMGARLAHAGVTANAVTITGFVIGIAAVAAIILGQFMLAAVLVVVSRLADGLDGAVARATQKTDFGGFLDIVLDFIFYGAVPLAFAIYDSAANALPAAVLLMAYFANGSAFLAFAIMAERRGLETTAQGQKSLYYAIGVAEGAETIAASTLFCILPGHFGAIAYVYAAMCAASAAGRLLFARRVLS